MVVVVVVLMGTAAGWRYAAAARKPAVHATREDPGRRLTDLIALIACVACRPGWCICRPPGPAAAGPLRALAAAFALVSR